MSSQVPLSSIKPPSKACSASTECGGTIDCAVAASNDWAWAKSCITCSLCDHRRWRRRVYCRCQHIKVGAGGHRVNAQKRACAVAIGPALEGPALSADCSLEKRTTRCKLLPGDGCRVRPTAAPVPRAA